MKLPSRILTIITSSTAAVAFVVAPTAAATVTTHGLVSHHVRSLRHSTSETWAGYDTTGGAFTSVSASWTQPAVSATSMDAYSSFWVGLDGYGSGSVEQLGTEADYTSGSTQYYAWYEMYPAYPVNFSNTVKPGDKFTASVTTDGAGKYTLKLADTTAGWSHSISKTYESGKNASAEIIAEAPSDGNDTLPLADYGTVYFTGAKVNGTNIGTLDPDPITQASGGVTKAVPSPLTNGTDFSITWKHG